jgi:thiamine-monophosphate kinase
MERSVNLGELGEFGLIDLVNRSFTSAPHVLLGPGDDAAVVRAADGRVVISTDLLVEGRHFRLDWSSAHDIGRRAAAANLSDIAAMGAAPTALVVGLAAPADLDASWVVELSAGIASECEPLGARVVGGDITRSDLIAISVTVIGDLQGRAPVQRSGAAPGDILAVAGRLGWAAAGLAVLGRGFRSPRVLVEAHRVPEPPYAAGIAAAQHGATAMIDVSDGLVADIRHIALASNVSVHIHTNLLVVDDSLAQAAAAFNVDPLTWVLTGGDDHALAATFPARGGLPPEFVMIGEVREGEPGVVVDGEPVTATGGWDHFRS